MMSDRADPFAGLVGVHQQLVRGRDGFSCGPVLYPEPQRQGDEWRPSFEHEAYQAVDPGALKLGGTESFHDLEDATVEAAILKVVDAEGPVHFRVLAERLLTAADVGRLGSRIRDRIAHHVDQLEARGDIIRHDDGIGRPNQIRAPRVRDRSAMADKLRDLDYVPAVELMQALFQAVLDTEGVAIDDAMGRALESLGFERLTENARDRLRPALSTLVARDMLREESGQLWPGEKAFVR